MAWLQQKRKGGNFLIQFRFQGVKYARSLKTKSRSAALGRKARVEETIRLVDSGRIEIPDKCSDVAEFLLNDGRCATRNGKKKRITLDNAFTAYLASLPRDAYDITTLNTTKFRMNVLRRILGKRTPLKSITKSKLQDFVNRRAQEPGKHGRPIHPATIKSDLRVLSVVWTFAQDEGYVDSVFPGRRLRLPKPDAKPPFQTPDQIRKILEFRKHTEDERKQVWQRVFLPSDQIERLLDFVETTAPYPFIYPMFVTAAHTGARRSELLRSLREDVHFDHRAISFREKKRVRHRQSYRTVPMSNRLEHVLKEWFEKHPGGANTFQACSHLPGSNKVRVVGEGVTCNEAQNYFNKTLVNSEWCELPGWHCLRHSFISNCAAKGIDERTIMSWVGHMTTEMQDRYRHLVPQQVRRELDSVFN